ncbi:MAG: T9SS type A sorting domain-containing protein [Lewinellaceae bacterium]|nr:T9SS type A sorting domain-containing protein [Phaeodactylibacter sp.]MCB9350981.1 T9SS type A sorting domain-containing protein [Lewinellaceae bacterium]
MNTRLSITIFSVALMLMGFTFSANAQCTDWVNPSATGGWTDFNSAFGGAPCDDGTGCPFNEITDFEVFAAEAYSVEGFQAGGTYAFSMCNGPGAGAWVPDFTIIAPSGAVDAFGAGDGDGCTITWTASEDGTYLIVINEADNCGGGSNLGTANGYPALSCTDGTAPCGEPVAGCSVGALVTNGTTSVCGAEGTFDLATDETDTIPTGGGFAWTFDDVLGGTGGAAGGFSLTNSSNVETFDADLNGVLSFNSLPPLSGAWVIRGAVYEDNNNAVATICDVTADSLIVIFGDSPTIDEAVNNGDGSATVSASGGVPPYSYEWEDGQTTATATGLGDGDYAFTITDAIGCTAEGTVTVMVSVGEISGLESLYLGPNPGQGLFNLRLSLNSPKDVRVEVLSLTGQKMLVQRENQTATLNRTLDLSGQPDGVYLLRLTVGEDELTKRIIKSN